MLKFTEWMRLKEDAGAAGGGGASGGAGGGASGGEAGGETSGGEAGGETSGGVVTPPSQGTTSGSIAFRPSVIGCGYCYPNCGCKNCKKKRKRKKKK